ncbi:MAG: hypothetical protein OJI67_24675, partial [Prosthecobacter sp.]|nr:hypothetical protein [Prosthecobacter sp.]
MRSLSLIQLTFISVCLFSGSLQAQTFPTSGNQYIWKVGDGTYSDWSTNYSYNGGSTTSAPNALRDVIFGWESAPTTARISLAPGVSTGSARSYNIYNGDFTFDFNGNTTTVWNKIWRFGNGSDSTMTVHFTGPSGSAIQFTELVIGDNGSSNNVFGGPDGTITFGSNVTYSFSSNGKLTVGSTQGGGGNVFNVLAGQDISRGVILVNAGVGNKIVIQDG